MGLALPNFFLVGAFESEAADVRRYPDGEMRQARGRGFVLETLSDRDLSGWLSTA